MGTSVKSGQDTAETLTATIVELVADRENVDPLELPPLNDAVDPDALSALFDTPANAVERVAFTYDGYRVVVEGPEQVQVEAFAEDG